jgi:hypothetical protein
MRSTIAQSKIDLAAYFEYQMVRREAVEPWQIVPTVGHHETHSENVEALVNWKMDL